MLVVIVGFCGSGKTTLGKKLSKQLNLPHFDTDLLIEQKTKKTVAELISLHGEENFRRMEREIVGTLPTDNAVVSFGGGTHTVCGNYLKDATVIYIDADAKTIFDRIHNDKSRPLYCDLPQEELEKLVIERSSAYQQIATVVVK